MKVAIAVTLLLGLVAIAYGSSHSEAPGTARQPQSDATDFYMFRSYETSRLSQNFVTFLLNVQGLQSPYAGPNYFSLSDSHFYEIYIDNNEATPGEDQVFQFVYGSSLGGADYNTTIYPADFDCDFLPYYKVQPGGITIPTNVNDGASDKNVAIPLKFAGSITAGDETALNWKEYYYLTYTWGDRDTQNKPSVVKKGTTDGKFTKPFDNAGEKTFPDYESYANQYIYDATFPNCNLDGKVFVGQRYEGFYINLGATFDLINMVPIPGFPGAIESNPLNNDLIDKNIDTFAIEIPTSCVKGPGDVIGAWTAIRQLKHADNGTHVPGAQVSRLGQPLINELIIGLRDKFLFNMGDPSTDIGLFADYVLYPTLPVLVSILFLDAVNEVKGTSLTTLAPDTPRNDLLIFVMGLEGVNKFSAGDMLRLNVSIGPAAIGSQNTLGLIAGDAAGFPNGRRPGDDIVDIALQVVAAGKLCTLGLGLCNSTQAPIGTVALNDGTPISSEDFLDAFPYLKTPLPGAKNGGKDLSSSPSSGLTFPSLLAIALAIVAGFFISFGFFA